MTYEELVDFLENKMSMSHVYQPLFVRALVDAGGVATVRQLAQVFLAQDESQLLYHEKRIKETPLKVLRRHEVITSDGQLVCLNTNALTLQQKAHIRMICEQRLQSVVQKRGINPQGITHGVEQASHGIGGDGNVELGKLFCDRGRGAARPA